MSKKMDFDTVILGFVGLVLVGLLIAGIITLVKKAFKPSENIDKLDSSDMIRNQKLKAAEIKAARSRRTESPGQRSQQVNRQGQGCSRARGPQGRRTQPARKNRRRASPARYDRRRIGGHSAHDPQHVTSPSAGGCRRPGEPGNSPRSARGS